MEYGNIRENQRSYLLLYSIILNILKQLISKYKYMKIIEFCCQEKLNMLKYNCDILILHLFVAKDWRRKWKKKESLI